MSTSAYLGLPVAIMLHTRPTSHKLAGIDQLSAQKEEKWQKENNHYFIQNIQERQIFVHLKNVVEPPDPYSSTSMSGLKAEHINSTPHRSNITVLGEKG